MPTKSDRPRGKTPSDFENRVTENLRAQDQVLERVERKLNAPMLNGGFNDLVTKVAKIETVTESLHETQATTNDKINDIHRGLYDPERGLYVKVKGHGDWIDTVKKNVRWFVLLVVGGAIGGVGKFLYDFAQGHVHYIP